MANVVLVLDSSGSMSQYSSSVINGFNEFIQAQKEDSSTEMKATLIVFSTKVNVVYQDKPIQEVEPLTSENYKPNGLTALNDAIGVALEGKEKSLVVVLTDGEENSSEKHTDVSIRELIKEKTAEDWKFIYLCNNLKTEIAGERLGFKKDTSETPATQNFSAEPKHFGRIFERSISKAVSSYRRSGSVEKID